MKLKAAKALCLILFIGVLPSSQALPLFCEHIWTVDCANCTAPIVMDCNTAETCKATTGDEPEQCFKANFTGYLKNNTVVDAIYILFYIVDDKEQAKKLLWKANNVELSDSYTAEGLVESLKERVIADTPAVRINNDWEITSYELDTNTHTFFADINEGSPITLSIPAWLADRTASQRPVVNTPISPDNLQPIPDDAVAEADSPAEPVEIYHPDTRKTDEIEYVKEHLTGNDESYCWHTSTPSVVYFTGSDQKICVITSKCINNRSKNNKVVDGEILACAFNKEADSCPSATQCLKDPTVRINFHSYRNSRYPSPSLESALSPRLDDTRGQ